MTRVLVALVIIGLLGPLAWAYDPGAHMYLGSTTYHFWRDYDPDFYSYLTRGENDFWGIRDISRICRTSRSACNTYKSGTLQV